MFNWLRTKKEVTYHSLRTRNRRLVLLKVNLDILEQYVNGYHRRRGVLYRDLHRSYSLHCNERSSFRTIFTLCNQNFNELPILSVCVDKSIGGDLSVKLIYFKYYEIFSDEVVEITESLHNGNTKESLNSELDKLLQLGMFDVHDAFIDFSTRLRRFLQISDEEFLARLNAKAKEFFEPKRVGYKYG